MHPTSSEQGVSVYNKDLPMGTQNVREELTSKYKTQTLDSGSHLRPPGYSSSTLCER